MRSTDDGVYEADDENRGALTLNDALLLATFYRADVAVHDVRRRPLRSAPARHHDTHGARLRRPLTPTTVRRT